MICSNYGIQYSYSYAFIFQVISLIVILILVLILIQDPDQDRSRPFTESSPFCLNCARFPSKYDLISKRRNAICLREKLPPLSKQPRAASFHPYELAARGGEFLASNATLGHGVQVQSPQQGEGTGAKPSSKPTNDRF